MVVRGVVTDALGRPVPGARVQLIQGPRPVAIAIAGADGSFEVRSTLAGRFVLLTSAPAFYPGIGQDFYGGFTDQITENVVLEIASVYQEVTVTATGLPTPLAQTSSAVTLIPDSDLATSIGVVDVLRQSPGVAAVQTGQAGGVTSLFVRGGNSTANQVLIDGIPAGDVGGAFDFGTVSSTALSGLELYRGPNSALYGTDAGASVLNLETPRGSATRPVLNYSGDAGDFHSFRDELSLSGAHRRLDYYTAFSRFDTSNALPRDRYHSATSAANLGYNITANTQAPLHPAQCGLGHWPAQRARLLRPLRRRQAGRPGHLLRPHAGEPPGGRLAQPRPLRHQPQAHSGAPVQQRRHAHHL